LQSTVQGYIVLEVALNTAAVAGVACGFVGVDTVVVGSVLGNDSPDLFGV
jgi:hypothetical protein